LSKTRLFCRLADTALRQILSAESTASRNFPDARYFKAALRFRRGGIGFAKSIEPKKQEGDESDEDHNIVFGSLASTR
jgi:hypothetical protein